MRGGIVLAAPYLPSAVALALYGFGPNPFMGLCMTVVSATLLFGRRSGLALLGLELLTIALVCFVHARGLVVRHAGWVGNIDSAILRSPCACS